MITRYNYIRLMKKKYCKYCEVELTQENSYGGAGRNLQCKSCYSAYQKAIYKRLRIKMLEQQKRYAKTEAGRRQRSENSKKVALRSPEKGRARAKLRYYVKVGEIIKPESCTSVLSSPCSGKIQAHHYAGYEGENWKEVWWLCVFHHTRIHLSEERSLKI